MNGLGRRTWSCDIATSHRGSSVLWRRCTRPATTVLKLPIAVSRACEDPASASASAVARHQGRMLRSNPFNHKWTCGVCCDHGRTLSPRVDPHAPISWSACSCPHHHIAPGDTGFPTVQPFAE
ncbi:hypothetical protein C8Q70DRAFT_601343 [Cubamyces menziesii]|nr:hypothetical protein C8Q70DRAFT_601343 [Cubamyces menziesii]